MSTPSGKALSLKTPVVIDVEAVGDPWTGRLLCVGRQEVGWVHAVVDEMSPGEAAAPILYDPLTPVVTHTKYDVRRFRLTGYDVRGPVYTTDTMAWLVDENTSLKLDDLVSIYLGETLVKRIKKSKNAVRFLCDDGTWVPLDDAPIEEVVEYNRLDVEATTRLFVYLWHRLAETGWLQFYLDEVVPMTAVLLDMECAGMPVDLDELAILKSELEKRREVLRGKLLEEAGLPSVFNLGSGPQLGQYLFSEGFELKASLSIAEASQPGFEVEKIGRTLAHGKFICVGCGLQPKAFTKHRKPKTDTKTLLLHYGNDSWIRDLVGYKKLDKIVTAFLEPIPKAVHDGRVYTHFNQTGTVTGRLSSSDPINLQQIPSHGELGDAVRRLFRGHLVVGDWSQLEPRLMAHFSGDPFLTQVFLTGQDIYLRTATEILGRPVERDDPARQTMKTYYLGVSYMAQPPKIAEVLTINGYPTSVETAARYLAELKKLLSTYFAWADWITDEATRTGYVTTIAGRVRHLAPSLDSAEWKIKSHGERQAVNSPIQGSAADVVGRTMVRWDHPDMRLLAQVHDELVYEYTHVPWHMHGRDPGDPGSPTPGLYCSETGACGQEDEGPSVRQIAYDLSRLKQLAETGHGFQLRVPLVFDVGACESWADKGGSGVVEWDDLEEEE